MARSVVVKLTADAGEYIVSVKEAKAVTGDLDDKVQATNRDLDKVPPAAARAAAAMKLLGDESGKTKVALEDGIGKGSTSLGVLDQRLAAARAEVRKLADEFNRTGDAGTLEKLFNADKAAKDLEKLGKTLTSTLFTATKDGISTGGKEGAKNASASLQGFLSTPAIGPVVTGAIVAGVIAALPLVGGALTGAAGLGLIGVGIAGAFHDPQVKAAAQDMVSGIKDLFFQATSGLVGPLEAALARLSHFFKNDLDLKSVFAPLGQYILPLERGLEGFFGYLLKGLQGLSTNLKPLIDVLVTHLPKIGSAIADMLIRISRNAGDNASAFDFLLTTVEGTIRAVGVLVEFFTHMYKVAVEVALGIAIAFADAFDWIPGVGKKLDGNVRTLSRLAAEAEGGKGSVDDLGHAADKTGGSVDSLNASLATTVTQAQAAATAFQNLSKGLDAAFNRTMGVDAATLQLATSMSGLADSVKQNGTSLKENTKEGQANLGVIQQAIGNINSLRDANIANGDSIDTANGKYQDQLTQLQRQLTQLGFNKDAIQAIIDKYRAIPGQVSTTVNVLGLDSSIYKLDSVTQKLNDLNGRITTTYLVTNTQTGQTQKVVHNQGYNRWGGIYQHAEEGLVAAGVYSARSPARYAFAEPATGGEAFVPKFGDYGRSTAILDQAARWYGGRFMPGGAPVVNVIVSPKDGALGALVDLIDVRVEQGNHATAAAVAGGPRL